jgi:hypothetical protein
MQRLVIAAAEAFICSQLSDGPKFFIDLEQASGFSRRSLQRAGANLNVRRTRDGVNGRWRWSLVDESERLTQPVSKPDYLFPAANAEPPAPTPDATADAYTVDAMLALAEQGGLHYPMTVSIREPASLEVTGKWSVRVFSTMGVVQESIVDDFVPDDAVCYGYIAIREWDAAIRRCRSLTLVLEPGRPPERRDWNYRRPKPFARARRRKET